LSIYHLQAFGATQLGYVQYFWKIQWGLSLESELMKKIICLVVMYSLTSIKNGWVQQQKKNSNKIFKFFKKKKNAIKYFKHSRRWTNKNKSHRYRIFFFIFENHNNNTFTIPRTLESNTDLLIKMFAKKKCIPLKFHNTTINVRMKSKLWLKGIYHLS
jgi:hypothetical protein